MNEGESKLVVDYHKPTAHRSRWFWRWIIGPIVIGSVHAAMYRGLFVWCARIRWQNVPAPIFGMLRLLATPGRLLPPHLVSWEWSMVLNAAVWGVSVTGVWHAWVAIRSNGGG
jgi:hypothetical protein